MAQNEVLENEPSTKRRRTDSSITRSALWLDDGNLVIQAESIQFRVHRSVLAMHSTVLRDCFAIPQPEEQEIVEGCPVVQFPLDSAADIENVLCILYKNPEVYDSQTPISMSQISTMIRLGKKYEFCPMYNEALRRLKQDYPRTLLGWKAIQGTRSSILHTNSFYFDIVNLAYENNIQFVLPMAFLQICTKYSIKRDHDSDPSAPVLVPGALHMCLMGRTTFSSHFFRDLFLGLHKTMPDKTCANIYHCPGALRLVSQQFTIWSADAGPITFPLSWAVIEGEIHKQGKRLCGACTKIAMVQFADAQEKFWMRLPETFGLPAWDRLEKENTI
ncbi:hypothetical protein M413DRAFT_31620 [Hebeloma cylindrosporum]|uniref:BTB domain-containing protein n=1 Tax=Hebeloma cylindrosporum TaxID=76867 RepID=A0A0C3BWY3_HEBCY|nr:hypothetical protein M413DRAFT_31620 [Hebeloma cylindrosporum h7]